MSASRSASEDVDDHQYAELYVDAESDEDEEHDPDYQHDDDEEDEEYDGAEEEEDSSDEFHDAEEANVEFVVQLETADEDGEGEGSQLPDAEQLAVQQRLVNLISNRRAGLLSPRALRDFLRRSHLNHVLFDEDDADADAYAEHNWSLNERRRRARDPDRFPKVPSEKGRELMDSGRFGANDVSSPIRTRKRLARRILDRELGVGDRGYGRVNQKAMAQSMIPRSDADMIINYDESVYSGQFSDDGNFFYSCVKDFRVRMYDTSNPYNWRHYKTVAFPFGSWTLTDASLSPDNKWLAYTSINSNVCLAPTDPSDTGDPYTLSLADHGARRGQGWRSTNFGIWSVRFSGDGRELVVGTNSHSIIVYDIETRRVLHSIQGHEDDVNAVCFADKSSPHILYSGSDDATIKVWDRRAMGDGREAGAFAGHVEGITYLDSKDDGRYLLSNGKDQSMKLWDLKMMYGTARFAELNPRQHTRYSDFDYRWGPQPAEDWFPHPHDNSLVTFRGHQVARTLIRCHFSPPASTGARYVYSGSHDGKVWVYNLDATVAGVVDVHAATAQDRPPTYRHYFGRRDNAPTWQTIVRDASWHPTAPFIAASALNGWNASLGTVTLHSYNESPVDEGAPRMGTGYDEKLRPIGPNDGTIDEEDEADEDFAPEGFAAGDIWS
ncbi:WD40 repeat-like protein [Xylariaceae sp. FL0804]|nr:WD40 repeat-like protein [Xylariaceae sp. FL0804]